jgi:uncharacterized protein YjbJ (UPF0337 family)
MTISHPQATPPGTSSDPEALRSEIARTRADMDATLAQLEYRVSPTHIKERQTEKVRSRWRSAKESVMGSAQHTKDRVAGSASDGAGTVSETAQEAPERVEQMTRGNPLAAGLVAFGIGALAGTLLPATDPEQKLATGLRENFEEPVKQQMQAAGQEMKGELQDHAQQSAEQVKGRAQEAADTTKQQAQGSAQQVQGRAQEAKDEVQQQR